MLDLIQQASVLARIARACSARVCLASVLGGFIERRAGISRHDAVAWGYARAADANGVDIIQQCEATALNIENGKVEAKKETLLKLAEKLELDPDVILAKAAKLDNEIENLISEKSDTVPQFLRTAKNLTDEQWKEITRQARKMDKDNI